MRSRVIPGSFVTIDRRVPVRRLKSVDLPTLGRPTITIDGSFSVISALCEFLLQLQTLREQAIQFAGGSFGFDLLLQYGELLLVPPASQDTQTAFRRFPGRLGGTLEQDLEQQPPVLLLQRCRKRRRIGRLVHLGD